MSLILEYTVNTNDHGRLLGDFLKQQALSKKGIIALKHRGGKISVNGECRSTRWQLHSNDLVRIMFPNEIPSRHLKPIKMDFSIVYEDDFLLVVDKKEGVLVMPTGNHDKALANGILAYYEEIGLKSTVHFVNRLDRGTSGLLIVAKYRHIHHLMMTDLARITREYYALVTGTLQGKGRVEAPIFRPTMDSIQRIVHEAGQHAITHYETIQTFGESTLIKCTLETGRTHQIRVHMHHLGHPILKDSIYGDGITTDMQLLHSYYLAFNHPITHERLCFETKIPSRFGTKDLAKNCL